MHQNGWSNTPIQMGCKDASKRLKQHPNSNGVQRCGKMIGAAPQFKWGVGYPNHLGGKHPIHMSSEHPNHLGGELQNHMCGKHPNHLGASYTELIRLPALQNQKQFRAHYKKIKKHLTFNLINSII
jgi:hypothetical protein